MDYLDQIAHDGCAVEPNIVDDALLDRLAIEADRCLAAAERSPAGVRGLLSAAPDIAALEGHPGVRRLVEPVLGSGAFVARSILFDKRADANWDVVWHQDKTIAVRERREVSGFEPWSVKSAVPHVQPPSAILERMLTVRLHLDECGPNNGPLLVIRGSHRKLLTEAEVQGVNWEGHPDRKALTVPRGAAIVMRPLTLHASRKAIVPGRRRVVHLEFAVDALPGGLEWARL